MSITTSATISESKSSFIIPNPEILDNLILYPDNNPDDEFSFPPEIAIKFFQESDHRKTSLVCKNVLFLTRCLVDTHLLKICEQMKKDSLFLDFAKEVQDLTDDKDQLIEKTKYYIAKRFIPTRPKSENFSIFQITFNDLKEMRKYETSQPKLNQVRQTYSDPAIYSRSPSILRNRLPICCLFGKRNSLSLDHPI